MLMLSTNPGNLRELLDDKILQQIHSVKIDISTHPLTSGIDHQKNKRKKVHQQNNAVDYV
jgi:hypothetical protein